MKEAAKSGNLESVESELRAGRCNLDAIDDGGNTALIVAACNGHQSAVRTLLAAGADIDVQNDNSWTALMIASYWGKVHIAVEHY